MNHLYLSILVLLGAGFFACGESPAPIGTIGCGCRVISNGTCEGFDAARGLEEQLLGTCESVLKPECETLGGLYDPLLACPAKDRFAVCSRMIPTPGVVRVTVWRSPDWGLDDSETIEAACSGLEGDLDYP